MPVVIIEMSERPSHSRNREALSNIRILVNVFVIVVIDEVVSERLRKNRKCERDQRDRNREFQNELGAHSFVIVRRAARANKLSILHVSGANSSGVFTGLIEEVGRVLWNRMTERGT